MQLPRAAFALTCSGRLDRLVTFSRPKQTSGISPLAMTLVLTSAHKAQMICQRISLATRNSRVWRVALRFQHAPGATAAVQQQGLLFLPATLKVQLQCNPDCDIGKRLAAVRT